MCLLRCAEIHTRDKHHCLREIKAAWCRRRQWAAAGRVVACDRRRAAMVVWWAARRRHCLLLLAGLLLVPCSLLVLVSGPDVSAEQALVSRLAELQARLQHLESQHRARQEEVRALAQPLAALLDAGASANASGGGGSGQGLGALAAPELRALLSGAGNASSAVGQGAGPPLRLPSAFHFLPHLLDAAGSLRPAYCLSKGRVGVSMVMGVPTVRRQVQSYLLATLKNLVDSMSPQEANDSLIIVFVAETDQDYVLQVVRQLESQFPEQLETGLLELVSPPATYYPDLDALRTTLGDPPERVRWRTKQNLDFAFLMMYAQPKGTFYVQLEDDILAKNGFVSTMKSYALQKISEKAPWFVIEFCQLGFIGKMFKCVDLPWLVQFFLMFYNDKPVDWLLDHLISTKICNLDKDAKHCKKAKSQLWLQYKPSLFQHIGTHSSLKGKVQKLKDKQFGRVALFFPHKNPEASVKSGIKHYKQYSLARAYVGETFFWGLLPQPGDQLTFTFRQPILIKRYLFRSGNAEHPSDRFYNTSVEVLPESSQNTLSKSDYNSTSDGYIIVGQFDSMGVAEGAVNTQLGPIRTLRLSVHSDSENWAILSEIHVVAGS
ncbi:alpha-1,3-mannosyl-glycoprotein 4-beta-N-acetylglucosaminyltransferase B isoform X1 [Schistocerca gregaria]|uniref:alpha-1,3-mannosyl-glycoprotein 4-beta-N-acetylglucosaminyltransferase B isoform X1 n=2 Tax=Schistocerca gregaria TaxID=7010 RepID=UPI00211E0924|nr:alpha-1,3-mannosyl-glycoprotein 4-beta-N-acetylglucosaminyltransferase B isoform X1 [Schistocerca gregaria]XP_049826872.1 alpha-1,3-mannosyl-glycoprotein 4-beta-N-acetylglucosaminyltransferase B isoform X1 [Schistocerca gregaria]